MKCLPKWVYSFFKKPKVIYILCINMWYILSKRFTHPTLVFILIETSWITLLEVTLQSSSSRWMLKICMYTLILFLVGSCPFISVHFQGQGSIENGIIGIYICPLNGVFGALWQIFSSWWLFPKQQILK
jgi:hypothetical protein